MLPILDEQESADCHTYSHRSSKENALYRQTSVQEQLVSCAFNFVNGNKFHRNDDSTLSNKNSLPSVFAGDQYLWYMVGIKRYRVLNLFLNLWLIIIALNIAIQLFNLLLGIEKTDTVLLLVMKSVTVGLLFIFKKHSIIIPDTMQSRFASVFRNHLSSVMQSNKTFVIVSVSIVSIMFFFFTFCITDFLPSFHGSIYHLLCMGVCYTLILVAVLFNIAANIKRRKKTLSEFTEHMLLLSRVVVVAALFVQILYVNSPFSLPPFCDTKYFDSELWQEDSSYRTENLPTDRQRMLMDLTRYILPDKKNHQVLSFLGIPTLRNSNKEMEHYEPIFFYELGKQPGLKGLERKTLWLLIRFNRNGDYKFSCIVKNRDGFLRIL